MDENKYILGILKDKKTMIVVQNSLFGKYSFQCVYNTEDCIEIALENKPCSIIIDQSCFDDNGAAACEKIKNIEKIKHIPILAITKSNSPEDKMLAYEVGASEYIVNPFSEELFLSKIVSLIDCNKCNGALKKEMDEAKSTAITAISGLGEQGFAMEFIERSFSLASFEDLSLQLFAVTNIFQLNAIVVMRTNNGYQWYSSTGITTPLECEVMLTLSDKGRFHDFGSRTQINYPDISVFIKNMPLDNMDKYGRIKDLLPVAINAADMKIKSLNAEEMLSQQTDDISNAFSLIEKGLENLSKSMQYKQNSASDIITNMLHELIFQLPSLGLDEDQEEFIIKKVESSTQKALNLVDSGEEMGAGFNFVLEELHHLVEKQNVLVRNLFNKENNVTTSNVAVNSDVKIELF